MILNYFDKRLSSEEARRINALSLAYIGDAVFEVLVREHLLMDNLVLSAHKLHVKAIAYVKAQSQSLFLRLIEEKLTEDEMQIYRKGRNAKSPTMPKSASVTDYRTATGFEALIGYLYITGQEDRIKMIISSIFAE